MYHCRMIIPDAAVTSETRHLSTQSRQRARQLWCEPAWEIQRGLTLTAGNFTFLGHFQWGYPNSMFLFMENHEHPILKWMTGGTAEKETSHVS